ncbi:MAG: hypothetical protein AAGJ86_08930, partial [Pseudomonadota bacterium]
MTIANNLAGLLGGSPKAATGKGFSPSVSADSTGDAAGDLDAALAFAASLLQAESGTDLPAAGKFLPQVETTGPITEPVVQPSQARASAPSANQPTSAATAPPLQVAQQPVNMAGDTDLTAWPPQLFDDEATLVRQVRALLRGPEPAVA